MDGRLAAWEGSTATVVPLGAASGAHEEGPPPPGPPPLPGPLLVDAPPDAPFDVPFDAEAPAAPTPEAPEASRPPSSSEDPHATTIQAAATTARGRSRIIAVQAMRRPAPSSPAAPASRRPPAPVAQLQSRCRKP